jgi:hypothetical protein
LGGGGVYISEEYRQKLKDSFLITHEIGHTYYLSHPTQEPLDHDGADKNCTMWYLHSGQVASRGQVDMSSGSANESKFCGKCLLKLRGWKVRALATVTPDKVVARPINPVLTFEGYKLKIGKYGVANTIPTGQPELVDLNVGAVDPADPNTPKTPLGPLGFLHVHKLTWESSSGDLGHLAGIRTRERVAFAGPTQASAFSEAADPDQSFVQEGSSADFGEASDDHSVMLPCLIVTWPIQPGFVEATQWYEYKDENGTWQTIGGTAIFLLRKEVYNNGNEWVLKFVKRNAPGNPDPFLFQMHYRIGPQPFRAPLVLPNPFANTDPNNPVIEKNYAIYLAGANSARYISESTQPITYDQLDNMGVVADPWL